MDDKLEELKEKQAEIGDKISLLQETNKRKDEEAAEIRQLIQECRDNLSRIKSLSQNSDGAKLDIPCQDSESPGQDSESPPGQDSESPGQDSENPNQDSENTNQDSENPNQDSESPNQDSVSPCIDSERAARDQQSAPKRPCGATAKSRCEEILNRKKDSKSDAASKKKKKNKERVSCKVDLNRMKVRVRGPSEDLKKLDATQLINLLEKFECQELIINTGDEIIKDPGEIRLIYLLHPGNIVMVAGIIMIAFLINTNICKAGNSSHFFLHGLYVGSFAFHYGMVLWMIFVRGYALRLGLNHDSFHLVDNIILPKYFTVCVVLSVLSLYSFLATNCAAPCSSWPFHVIVQIAIVVATFFMELTTICYIVPAVIKLRDITDDYIIDEDAPECAIPESYEKNLVKLRKLSWTICLINFLTLLFLGANIYYITCKLNAGSAN